MSSSDKLIDWSVFRTRPESCPDEILSPAAEIGSVLQQFHAALQTERTRADSAHRILLDTLARQAVLLWKLDAAVSGYESDFTKAALTRIRRHFRVIAAEMSESLTDAGITYENSLGLTYETVVDRVQIQGWVPKSDLACETVVEVLEPIVLWLGKVIHPGRVVMGRPAHETGSDGPTPSVTS